jgi:hypothetical protein
MMHAGKVHCPSTCDFDSTSSCYCKSANEDIKTLEDIDALSFDNSLDLAEFFWTYIGNSALEASNFVKLQDEYNGYDDYYVPLNKETKELITDDQMESLCKLLLSTIYFQGHVGLMTSGAAANDPLFWVMHQLFDKALHALRLSPLYNTQGFDWNNADGYITFDGTTPFTWKDFEPYLGSSSLAITDKDNGDYLTNKQLWSLLAPETNAIPYVYDKLTTWGDCSFDPFSEEEDSYDR